MMKILVKKLLLKPQIFLKKFTSFLYYLTFCFSTLNNYGRIFIVIVNLRLIPTNFLYYEIFTGDVIDTLMLQEASN